MRGVGQAGYSPLTEAEWNTERRAMEIMDTAFVGRRILVMDVAPENEGELGYTSKGSIIHVAKEHEYYKRFTMHEAAAFRFGVNVHEALHQIYTNFDYFYEMAEGIPAPFEQEMFAQIFNLVEDPAIENFASQAVGGIALDALYFCIEKIYEAALPVSGSQNHGQALEEYLDALIQFGDRGIIKGGFSSDVAREYFNRTAPIIYKAINEPDGTERVKLALEVYNTVKTLWAGRPASKTKKAFQSVTKRYAKSAASGSGRGKIPQETEDTRNGRREDEIRRQKKKEEESLRKEAGYGEDTARNTQGQDKPDGKPSDKTDNKAGDEPGEGTDKRTDICKNETNEPCQEDAGDNDNSADNGFSQKSSNQVNRDADKEQGGSEEDQENSRRTASDAQDCEGPVFQYDPEIVDKFAAAMKRYMEQADAGPELDNGMKHPESYLVAIQSENQQFVGVKEKNVVAFQTNMGSRYADILNTAAWIIGPLVTQLKKVFTDDRGGKAYTQRGKASLKRAASGKVTTRMFERRIQPGDKADMCLMLLVDLSGSMKGSKGQAAKLAAIVLCEVFACFKTPVYCMGFQHTHGADAYQTHFVQWRNTLEERMSILSAVPGGNNFDSYSIRYATEVLRKRTEKHKLMCVISDGLPSHFFTGKIGIQENTKAILDARLAGVDVFGMAVAAGETAEFREMYGKGYFINITHPQDLADQAAGIIKTVVKNW